MTQTLLYKLIPHGILLLSVKDPKKSKVGQELCWVPNLKGATHKNNAPSVVFLLLFLKLCRVLLDLCCGSFQNYLEKYFNILAVFKPVWGKMELLKGARGWAGR